MERSLLEKNLLVGCFVPNFIFLKAAAKKCTFQLETCPSKTVKLSVFLVKTSHLRFTYGV